MLHCLLPTHQPGKPFPKTMPAGKHGSPTPPFKVLRATKGQAQQRGSVGFGRGKTDSLRRGSAAEHRAETGERAAGPAASKGDSQRVGR